MRLDWNEVRAKAGQFSEDWKLATRESADKHSFWNAFFGCLGLDPRKVVTYEQRVANLPSNRQGFIDVFIPGKLIIEHKSAGLDLKKASNQAMDYFDWLPEAQRPRYILTCDFQRWHLHDLEEDRHWRFTLGNPAIESSRRPQLLPKLLHRRLNLSPVFLPAFGVAFGQFLFEHGVLLRRHIALAEFEGDEA